MYRKYRDFANNVNIDDSYNSFVERCCEMHRYDIADVCRKKSKKGFPLLSMTDSFMGIQYFLVNRIENKIIGRIAIRCQYNAAKKMKVPEIASCEIKFEERNKGYGKIMSGLFLENNNIDVNVFAVRIFSTNLASLKMVKHFNPTFIGIVGAADEEVQYFDLPNIAYTKRQKRKNE